MAKIQFSAVGITDMRAKLNGQVFSRNRGGAFVRTKVTPNNPRTTDQQAVRSLFGSISQQWSGLTEEQRTSFNNAVENWKKTDVFGNLRTPSGKALYQRLNNELAITGQTLVTTAPGLIEIPLFEIGSAEFGAPNAMSVNMVGDLTGLKVCVYATAPLSQGTSNANNRFRLIKVENGANDQEILCGSEYVAKFGSIPAGANIQVRIKLVGANGQASSIAQVKAVPF